MSFDLKKLLNKLKNSDDESGCCDVNLVYEDEDEEDQNNKNNKESN